MSCGLTVTDDGKTLASQTARPQPAKRRRPWEFARHRENVLNMEAGDETTREFDGEAAEERRAQGSTVAALNAFSAGVASEVRVDLGFVDPDEAIKTLAGAVDQDTLQVPRLLVLDSLVRFASRRGDEFRAREAEIDPLLEALVRKSQVPETEVGRRG